LKAIVYKDCALDSDVFSGIYNIQSGTGTDNDQDGVADDDDEFPSDPARAFNNYYPAYSYGTLAYEDLWPGKGDYDFNDLVLDYRFNVITNGNNNVVELFGTFVINAFGASFENGFGFQLGDASFNQADLIVTGCELTETYIMLNNNGTEANQSIPTIIVYDNAYKQMQHPGTGIGVNTDPTATYVTPDTLNITITFPTNAYSFNQLNISNFNPFLIVNKTRGREVHLPDYPPTSLVDPSYYGTFDDNSIALQGRYYKTELNLPWAINIYESFAYPIEKTPVLQAYNHFAEWAQSGGTLYPDWYRDLSGYRNMGNIYQKH
jgi:LruC domain-containing protein